MARRAVHGHSYRLRLHLVAPLDAVHGWTIDFGDVKALFSPVFERLDHQPLHELPGVADGGAAAIAHWVRAPGRGRLLPQIERIDLYETARLRRLLQWGAAPAGAAGLSGAPSPSNAMTYAVKEIFYTLQGEGAHSGRPAVFCRFAGCNLWSGLERDRDAPSAASAIPTSSAPTARTADASPTAAALVDALQAQWPAARPAGRAPVRRLHRRRAAAAARRAAAGRTALRAAGTWRSRPTARRPRRRASTGSASAPRPARALRAARGNELKLVFPQAGAMPEAFAGLDFRAFLPAADGRAAIAAKYAGRRSHTASVIRNGA